VRSFEVIFCKRIVYRTSTEVTCSQKISKDGQITYKCKTEAR